MPHYVCNADDDLFKRLIEVISAPNAREAENINPTENAISAATKILKFNASAVNVNEILPVWYKQTELIR